MGCGGSKATKHGNSPSPRQHDGGDDEPPVSPSMQCLDELEDRLDAVDGIAGATPDPRHDPEARRFPVRDTSSIQANSKGKSRLSKSGSMLLFMSYRLLSEKAMSELEHECPEFAQSWDYRKKRVVKEVKENKPDVLCLQGVSDFGYFETEFQEIGLIGAFESTKAAVHPGEGCAVFVRAGTLKIEKTFDLKGVGVAALVMEADSIEDDTGTIVVSAWLHDEAVDGGNMFDCIDTAMKDENFKRHSLVIAGELGLPTGEFVQNAVDVDECVFGISDIKSAYKDAPYSVCSTSDRCLRDYILYKSDLLAVIGTMAMVDAGTIQTENGLPNGDWPSSHASLLAMLEIKASSVIRSSPAKSTPGPCDTPGGDDQAPDDNHLDVITAADN